MAEEEKGFVIKDRRSFDEKGDLKDKKHEEKLKKEVPGDQAPKKEAEHPPLPEISFNSLIFSLSSTVLFHLGEIADPQTGKKAKDLPLAKNTIDIIAMLKEKTEGNLTEEEKKFIENILADLRLRYVNATK
ncbi:MAG: hypothetical protein B1H12_03870 [Desulfobacteraceae bacterium 4484_190.2]|nr:MAG: hypothetical protein B1H12_03870 [Desulfobacteraceae bacterium 4484_190.2]